MAASRRKSGAAPAQGGNGAAGRSGDQTQLDAARFAIIQTLMRRGYLEDQEARKLCRKLLLQKDDGMYLDFLGVINGDISFAGFEVVRLRSPMDGKFYIGFVNRLVDSESKKAHPYVGKDKRPSLSHSSYLKHLLQQIVLARNAPGGGIGHITRGLALNLEVGGFGATQASQDQQPPKRLSISEREAALNQYLEDGWLGVVPNGQGLTLGVRALLELPVSLLKTEGLSDGIATVLGNLVAGR